METVSVSFCSFWKRSSTSPRGKTPKKPCKSTASTASDALKRNMCVHDSVRLSVMANCQRIQNNRKNNNILYKLVYNHTIYKSSTKSSPLLTQHRGNLRRWPSTHVWKR